MDRFSDIKLFGVFLSRLNDLVSQDQETEANEELDAELVSFLENHPDATFTIPDGEDDKEAQSSKCAKNVKAPVKPSDKEPAVHTFKEFMSLATHFEKDVLPENGFSAPLHPYTEAKLTEQIVPSNASMKLFPDTKIGQPLYDGIVLQSDVAEAKHEFKHSDGSGGGGTKNANVMWTMLLPQTQMLITLQVPFASKKWGGKPNWRQVHRCCLRTLVWWLPPYEPQAYDRTSR